MITLPLYPHPLLLLASDALKGIAQHLPLKQLVLDHCATQGIMATIGTITTLEKLCLQGSKFCGNEAAKGQRPALVLVVSPAAPDPL